MAKIVCISKYPPIEGGIAAKTFWLAKALADRGHEIHVVTDRLGIAGEYSHPEGNEIHETENVIVHRPQGDIPWHIPADPHKDIELLDLAVDVIHDVKPDVIDTDYLVPYGILGFLASRITGVPFVLRHGGSDVQKFLNAGIFHHMIKDALHEASLTITDANSVGEIKNHAKRVVLLPPYIPDPSSFRALAIPENGRPVLALIGKSNYHWRHKGWHRAVDALKRYESVFKLVVVAQGIGLDDFKKYVKESFHGELEWRTFVHPMNMPELLNTVEGVFVLNSDAPFPAFSNILVEALSCGATVIVDSQDAVEFYEKAGINMVNSSDKLLAMTELISEEVSLVAERLRRSRKNRANEFATATDFNRYIGQNEKALLSARR